MSALGKLLRTYLVGRTDYGTTIPGGISPENAPVGSSLPYVVYQGISTQRQMLLRGTPAVITERVTLTAVAETRSDAQGVLVWIAEQIEATSGRHTVSGVTIHHWRIEEAQDQSELGGDGTDELARLTTIDVVGTYQ
jgi:hypothetical protein